MLCDEHFVISPDSQLSFSWNVSLPATISTLIQPSSQPVIQPCSLVRKPAAFISFASFFQEEWDEMTAAIEAGIKSGWVQPIVAREYPLAEAKQAQLDIMDSSLGASGNLVLKI